jgi:hypothetical protein
MAGKAKSVYLSVVINATHKTVFRKTFFDTGAYAKFIADPEFSVQYPAETYHFVREIY